MIGILRRARALTIESADNDRRSFIRKMGAGVSGVLASTAVVARAGTSDSDDAQGLSRRVALLEEEKALRELHRAFEHAMDNARYEDIVAMFTDDAEIVFNGGVFANRAGGVSRLYLDRFPSGKTGKRMEPAPGFELDAEQRQESVEIFPDRQAAKAVFPYSIQVGTPIESETSLASMARLHGEGVRTWWEGGTYLVTYRKDTERGRWRISRLEYNTLSRADYRPGRSYARAISVSSFATCYPQDRQGPDALV